MGEVAAMAVAAITVAAMAVAAMAVAAMVVAAQAEASGTSTRDGTRALSVDPPMWATSATVTARCTAATTTGISLSAPREVSPLGVADGTVREFMRRTLHWKK